MHYLTNCLEGLVAQVRWDLRSGDSYTFKDLLNIPRVVYGSVSQAEVYSSKLKILWRKKGESLTDLAQDVRKLILLAYPDP